MSRGVFVLVVCLVLINIPVVIDLYNDCLRLAFALYNSVIVFIDFLLLSVGLIIYIIINWNVPFKK
jgi:hypothetical protein